MRNNSGMGVPPLNDIPHTLQLMYYQYALQTYNSILTQTVLFMPNVQITLYFMFMEAGGAVTGINDLYDN